MPLSDPSALPCLSEDGNNINVVIETPKGSRNKFAFDEKQKIFRLKKFCRLGWHSLMISGLYLPRGPTTATRWTLLMSFDASRKNYYWSVELSKAIAQVEKYLYEIQRHSDTFKVELHTAKGIDINVVRPRGYIVAGKRSDITSDKMRHDFRILNESLKNIDVILYDDLVENLETFLSRLKAS